MAVGAAVEGAAAAATNAAAVGPGRRPATRVTAAAAHPVAATAAKIETGETAIEYGTGMISIGRQLQQQRTLLLLPRLELTKVKTRARSGSEGGFYGKS
jgi:hypothetical protein